MFVINPLHLRSVDGLFSTHPKTEERVRRLLEMDKTGRFMKTQDMHDDVFGDKFASFGGAFDEKPKNPWV